MVAGSTGAGRFPVFGENNANDNYIPSDRLQQKQIARETDDKRLQNGEVSRDVLRREVGFFSALDVSKSTIVRRRVSLKI